MSITTFWLAHVTITDPDAYARYQAMARPVFERHQAVFFARGDGEVLEGPDWQRHVVIGFSNFEAALACYHDPEYEAARSLRAGAAEVSITLINATSRVSLES